jgi:hypothetical protein
VTTHRPVEDGEAFPAIDLATRVEYVGGSRDGQIEDRTDLPEAIAGNGGSYRRSVRCAEDGAMRYVWHDATTDGRT